MKKSYAPVTVAWLANTLRAFQVEPRPKSGSAAFFRATFEHHILPLLGDMALTEIGGTEVNALHHSLRDTPTVCALPAT